MTSREAPSAPPPGGDEEPEDSGQRERHAPGSGARVSEAFVGVLGHDLRNPLSAIMTAASLLEVRADSERITKPVGRILVSAEKMDRMISQLLDFTRIRLGEGLLLQPSDVELPEVCHAICEELEPVYQRRIGLDCVGDPRGVWDRDRVAQLLSSLMINACRHGAPDSPVLVRVDGTAPEVVRVEVRNRGAIPADVLPVLFEPVRQAPGEHRRARREGSSALGMGLYIARAIAVAHGGTLGVESSEPVGTAFVVELPRHPPEREAGAAAPPGLPA